jgi:hypothetical protein
MRSAAHPIMCPAQSSADLLPGFGDLASAARQQAGDTVRGPGQFGRTLVNFPQYDPFGHLRATGRSWEPNPATRTCSA